MKKVFSLALTGFALAVILISAAFAAEVVQPKLPENGFYDSSYSTWDCGKLMTLYYHDQNKGDEWRLYFLEDNEYSLVARIIRPNDSTIFWVDNNMDGHFDETISDINAFLAKYPTPCDAVK